VRSGKWSGDLREKMPLGSSVQGQVGRGFEQPALVEGIPAPVAGLEQDGA